RRWRKTSRYSLITTKNTKTTKKSTNDLCALGVLCGFLLPVLVKEPRGSLEHVAQALQGTNMPIAGGRGLDAEHLGGLVIGELLEMPQGQDLPVDRVQGVDGFLKDELHLGALHGLGHRREPAEQLGGEGDAGGLRHGPAVQRHLAARVAHLRAEVMPVDQLQPLPRE